jgi:glycerophosphoryl diester phosphodiesterase
MLMPSFDLQGHRGARGLKPENTLLSFEAALDAGVTTIETDLHLTANGVVVLCHDPRLRCPPCSLPASSDAPPLEQRPAVAQLTLRQLRAYRVDVNPDPRQFPEQNAATTPVAARYAAESGLHSCAIPTLGDLFAFVASYAGEVGEAAGKTADQRRRAARVRFDLELKRVPFYPEVIGDRFDGSAPGRLEEKIIAAVRQGGVVARTTVRSFDNRAVRILTRLEPGLTGAILIADTALIDPAEAARWAGASLFCPSVAFVDADIIRRVHDGGVRVVPWTVNDREQWERLLDWGVDGLTTDYPDRLATLLAARGMSW